MSDEKTADLLGRAAAHLRRSLLGVTEGPWTASPVWSPDSTNTSAVYSAALPPGSEVVGSSDKPRQRPTAVSAPTSRGGIWNPCDAVYIATMDPLVGGALADLLEATALDIEKGAIPPWPASWDVAAPALARAILGEA